MFKQRSLPIACQAALYSSCCFYDQSVLPDLPPPLPHPPPPAVQPQPQLFAPRNIVVVMAHGFWKSFSLPSSPTPFNSYTEQQHSGQRGTPWGGGGGTRRHRVSVGLYRWGVWVLRQR
jgi:hypothetical protein